MVFTIIIWQINKKGVEGKGEGEGEGEGEEEAEPGTEKPCSRNLQSDQFCFGQRCFHKAFLLYSGRLSQALGA